MLIHCYPTWTINHCWLLHSVSSQVCLHNLVSKSTCTLYELQSVWKMCNFQHNIHQMIITNLAMSLVVCLICRCMSDTFFLRWPWVCSFLPDFTCASPLSKDSVQIHVHIRHSSIVIVTSVEYTCIYVYCTGALLCWKVLNFKKSGATVIFLASLYVLL